MTVYDFKRVSNKKSYAMKSSTIYVYQNEIGNCLEWNITLESGK